LAQARRMIELSQKMAEAAYDGNTSVEMLVAEAERELYALSETDKYGGFQSFRETLQATMELAAKARQRDGGLSGLATGLIDLDRYVGGMQPSDLIILAGRPGMGKTSLATNIAFNVARAWRGEVQPDGRMRTVDGGVVGFFSLEMSAEQIGTRVVAEQADVQANKIRRGKISDLEFEQIGTVAGRVGNLPLYIDECGGLSVAQIASRARRLKRTYGLDLLVIDYLQLITGTTQRSSENRVNEITEITMRLKTLAKELAVPILALSQLSRAVESREDKRPQLPDLRESGSIEQDADVVMFVFREEYYHKIKKPRETSDKFAAWLATGKEIAGKAEIIIAKHRHGPVGTVELQFDAGFTRFGNLVKE
jgi:replicative DNA helicase